MGSLGTICTAFVNVFLTDEGIITSALSLYSENAIVLSFAIREEIVVIYNVAHYMSLYFYD